MRLVYVQCCMYSLNEIWFLFNFERVRSVLSQLILYFQQYTQFNTLINIFYFEISGDTTTVVYAVAAAPSLKSNSALISWGAYTSSLEWYEVGSQKAALVIARTALRQCQRFSVNTVLVRILQQRVHHSSVSHAL